MIFMPQRRQQSTLKLRQMNVNHIRILNIGSSVPPEARHNNAFAEPEANFLTHHMNTVDRLRFRQILLMS